MATNNRRSNANREKTTPERWHNITGSMMVFGEEKENKRGEKFVSYNTSVGKKDDKGEWDNCYIGVSFAKDCDPGIEGGFLISIKSAFITFDTWKTRTGKIRKALRIVITDFDFPE